MEKKQTALDFYVEQYRKLEISLDCGEITIGQFASKIIKLHQQALQMEREQIEDAFEKGVECGDDNGMSFIDIHAKKYYDLTFKP